MSREQQPPPRRFIAIPFSSSCRSHSSVDVVDTSRHAGKKPHPQGIEFGVVPSGASARPAGKGESLVARLLRGFKNLSQIFAVYDEDDEEEEEREMVIGLHTDVKHVAHIGWDGSTSTTTSLRSWNRAAPPPPPASSSSSASTSAAAPAPPQPQQQHQPPEQYQLPSRRSTCGSSSSPWPPRPPPRPPAPTGITASAEPGRSWYTVPFGSSVVTGRRPFSPSTSVPMWSRVGTGARSGLLGSSSRPPVPRPGRRRVVGVGACCFVCLCFGHCCGALYCT